MMPDTTPDATRVRLAAIGRLTPSERVEQVLAFSESMRRLSLARLRTRYPDHTDLQLVELLLDGALLPRAQGERRPGDALRTTPVTGGLPGSRGHSVHGDRVRCRSRARGGPRWTSTSRLMRRRNSSRDSSSR